MNLSELNRSKFGETYFEVVAGRVLLHFRAMVDARRDLGVAGSGQSSAEVTLDLTREPLVSIIGQPGEQWCAINQQFRSYTIPVEKHRVSAHYAAALNEAKRQAAGSGHSHQLFHFNASEDE